MTSSRNNRTLPSASFKRRDTIWARNTKRCTSQRKQLSFGPQRRSNNFLTFLMTVLPELFRNASLNRKQHGGACDSKSQFEGSYCSALSHCRRGRALGNYGLRNNGLPG